MRINARGAFLCFCVVHSPFGHIQNHRAKIVAEYVTQNPYLYPESILDLSGEDPGRLGLLAIY
jgi:hypothetical protein